VSPQSRLGDEGKSVPFVDCLAALCEGRVRESGVLGAGVPWLKKEETELRELAEGCARKNRWESFRSSSSSTRTADEPAQNAKVFVGSWHEKPFGSNVVVPITVCRDKEV
jgi:hypothetical protein